MNPEKFEHSPSPEPPQIETAWAITGYPDDRFDQERGESLTGNLFSAKFDCGAFLAGSTYAGYETKPEKSQSLNQDVVFISPKQNIAAVIDGMGSGGDDSRRAALMLATSLEEFPWNEQTQFQPALNAAYEKLMKARSGFSPINENAGATFLAAHFQENNDSLKVKAWYAGDVKSIMLDENSHVVFASKEHSIPGQRNIVTKLFAINSLPYQNLHDLPAKYAKRASISAKVGTIDLTVKKGQRALIYSDGIGDNFTPDEIAGIIKKTSGKEAVEKIDRELSVRMKELLRLRNENDYLDEDTPFQDGYKKHPKDDNRSLLVIDY